MGLSLISMRNIIINRQNEAERADFYNRYHSRAAQAERKNRVRSKRAYLNNVQGGFKK